MRSAAVAMPTARAARVTQCFDCTHDNESVDDSSRLVHETGATEVPNACSESKVHLKQVSVRLQVDVVAVLGSLHRRRQRSDFLDVKDTRC